MKYVRVVEWSVKAGDIHLEMLGEDDAVHSLEVGGECAGVLAAALAAEDAKLHGSDKDRQFIRPTALQTARSAKGEPMLMMTLAGGVELPLVFKPESLGVLIGELEKLQRSLQPGSQIRWN